MVDILRDYIIRYTNPRKGRASTDLKKAASYIHACLEKCLVVERFLKKKKKKVFQSLQVSRVFDSSSQTVMLQEK